MAKIGLDFDLFYWVKEADSECEQPLIKGNPEEYSFEYIDIVEIKSIGKSRRGLPEEELLRGYQEGQICIGLRHNKDIAAYMFIELNDFNYNRKRFKLKENEAYLLNMYTFELHRGKNLAPYLRYLSYQLLHEMGRDTIYSISAYFNKSTIRFKSKLNAKHQKMYLYVILFKKYHSHFLLRTYN
ncbi:hypothetical protein HPE63_03325 [Maribacter arenosus]|uniref:N-acetyltransferase domain-containing protein n=2 Tax=Maribacter arenosus TaxID=1854708 RepID=A0ABR7VAW7_9FLAO|nr:hypothetical protein [Maribacter arenosus]